ncbi:MAG TPA: CDP-alcohol phosphatidyltransferase family protein [Mycobacteriales bacterium]|nr:CDP-alcohol phosphatidyltransferase family protein [Mycobacteriales bacterium]
MLTALVLTGAVLVLVVASVTTARRPAVPLADRAEYLRRWAPLHGGYQPEEQALTGRWLAVAYTLAKPMAARGLSPDVLTAWGVLVSASAAAIASARGRWPLAAAVVVVVAGLLDNIDGAVAILAGRATRWGFVLDSLADRLSDAAYLVPLWLLGAPGPLCVLGGGLMGLQEYARARAGNAGMREIGVVTIWERPTRVILTALLLLGCGLLPRHADAIAFAGAAAWVGLGGIGLAQLLLVVRRTLRD